MLGVAVFDPLLGVAVFDPLLGVAVFDPLLGVAFDPLLGVAVDQLLGVAAFDPLLGVTVCLLGVAVLLLQDVAVSCDDFQRSSSLCACLCRRYLLTIIYVYTFSSFLS